MPIYEYQCDKCGHRFELMQRMSDAPPSECPECGNNGVKKLISKVGFKLKGTGWYETDFKGKKTNDQNNDQKKSNSDTADKPSAPNDTKKKKSADVSKGESK